MSALGWRLHWLMKLAASVRRRFISTIWRGILGRLGESSSLGPGWRIERPESVFIGDGVTLGREGWISFGRSNPDQARFIVGNGTYIGNYFLASVVKKIEIADKVMISDRVFIGDCNHRHSRADIPIRDQGLEFGGEVTIGFGSWIGVGAAILPGVSIGRNCVVGANAVVTDNVPDGAVVGGIPAKPLSLIH